VQLIGEYGLACSAPAAAVTAVGCWLDNEAGQESWVQDLQWYKNSSREQCGVLMRDPQGS